MKWALASIGLLILIVVFSLAALNQKNVVFRGGVPQCPHCRTTVNDYSSLCASCGQAFDWDTWDTTCTACLSELDAEWVRKRTAGRAADLRPILVSHGAPADDEKALGELVTIFESVDRGDCTFCGGTGAWLAPGVVDGEPRNGHGPGLSGWLEKRLDLRCPVCVGSGRCVLCDGDHVTTRGREAARIDLDDLKSDLDRIDPRRDDASAEAAWVRIQRYLQSHSGKVEVAGVPSFDRPGVLHLDRAARRLALIFDAARSLP